MTAAFVEVRVALAAARGTPALVQSRYGVVGNLELVFADVDDGLWVHWRNNDPDDVRPGAVAGGWSAGLRFARGRAYDACALLQATHGPDFLEVLARSGDDVYRTYWSPGNGFSDPEWAFNGVGDLALAETGAGTFVAIAGSVAHTTELTGYPRLRWSPSHAAVPEQIVVPFDGDAIAACRASRAGIRTEVVVRRKEALLHGALGPTGEVVEPLSPIRTHAWVDQEAACPS